MPTGVQFDIATGTVRDVNWEGDGEYAPAALDPWVECGNGFTEFVQVTIKNKRMTLWYAGPCDPDKPTYSPSPCWRILGGKKLEMFFGNGLFVEPGIFWRRNDILDYINDCPLTAADIAPYIVRLIYEPRLMKERAIGFATVAF